MRPVILAALMLLPFAAPADAALEPGATAALFKTRGAMAGKVIDIDLAKRLKKGPVVLYFFPAAFTPGCNAEAKAFAENLASFTAAGATVIGMSADPVEPLKRFSREHCAGKFVVGSAGPEIIKQYDVALGKESNGHAITSRTSYVIAPDGRIVYALDEMSPANHIRGTLAAVQRLKAGKQR